MEHIIETQWMGKMQFNAVVNGHTIMMDAPERAGGEDNGPIPKPFVLTALSGCTGMDVASLLRKSAHLVTDFYITTTGQLSKQAPITYTSIHLSYFFTGDAENQTAALQAVTDSQEKYCGVSYLLKKAIPVTWEVHYNNTLIFNNQLTEATILN